MFTTIHIILGVLSLIYALAALVLMDKRIGLYSRWLSGGTLFSGIVLVYEAQASIVRVCISGVLLWGLVFTLNKLTNRRLSLAKLERTN